MLEYDGSSGAIKAWYAYGPGSNEVLNRMDVPAGTRQTLVPDIQGSFLGTLESATGTLTKRGYLPFGEGATTTGTFAYTGLRIDPETNGRYYARARMYLPPWGRFFQPDPIGYAGGINIYSYVHNDPLNLVDRMGLSAESRENPTENRSILLAADSVTASVRAAIVRGNPNELRALLEVSSSPAERAALERAIFRVELTGSRTVEEAARRGFSHVVRDPPFNPHGQRVFTDGRNFLTRDVDSHSGGVWKLFDRAGNRLGTYDQNMIRIGP